LFPNLGCRLLEHVLRDWPIRLNQEDDFALHSQPRISILIPVGGSDRMHQFRLALAAALGQVGVAFEVLVVEQSSEPTLAMKMPRGVRYFHQVRACEDPFNKSSALNFAAREASGEFLLFLDADLLLPSKFAAECARVLDHVDGVRPGRFVFYLDRSSSERLSADFKLKPTSIESVVANTPMPLAVRTSTFWEVGGHDESYVGWGGEDSEFLDRLRTRSVCEGGWMPLVHAWHPAAPGKQGERNRKHHRARMAVTAQTRITQLLAARLRESES
jgi:glycosyltransferase involved in cell wall biosynthesis